MHEDVIMLYYYFYDKLKVTDTLTLHIGHVLCSCE